MFFDKIKTFFQNLFKRFKKKRVAIFRGKFDPVHTDHLNLAQACHETLGFDEVWFIPTYLEHFDPGLNASSQDRLAMLNLLAVKNSWIKINPIEVNQQKPTSAFETMNFLVKEKENKKIKFSFIIGSDQLDQVEQWPNFNKLRKLIPFQVFKLNNQYNEEILEKYNWELVEFDQVGLSSKMVRNLQNLAWQIPEINQYLNYHLLYLTTRLKNQLDDQNYEHSLNVGKMAKQLAKELGVDENKALVAGTLHDIAKCWTKEKQEAYIQKYLPRLLNENEPRTAWHAFAGMLHLRHDWMIKDEQILSAVFNHLTAKPLMSKLDKIIFCVDKISVERSYFGIEQVRKLCFDSLDLGFNVLLKNQYLLARNNQIETHNKMSLMLEKSYQYYLIDQND